MKFARQIVFWILLLIGGAWVVAAVTYHTGLPGSGAGVGRFSYWFRYTLEPYSHEIGDDELIGMVTIEGTAPVRFMVDGGKSPEYREVSMEWAMFSGVHGGETEGTCTVDLREKQIVSGADRHPLDQSSLHSLFGLAVVSKQSDQFLDDVLSKLEAAALGTIPRPRHHTYYFEEPPTRGRLQHFAHGDAVRYPILIWVGVWLLLALATAVNKNANKLAHPTAGNVLL